MANPALNIPRRSKAAIAQIHSLRDAAFDELVAALESVEPFSLTVETRKKIEALAPSVSPTQIKDILRTTLSLQLARSVVDAPLEQFCRDICEAMQEAGPHQLALSEDDCGVLSKRLQRLFSLDSLSISAKGRDLLTEQHHVYIGSRIFTDLRSVFGDSPDEPPVGMVLFHVLKLGYYERGDSRPRDFYISLDESDLQSLKKVIERAETKARTLRSKLQDVGIRCLQEENEE